MTNTCHIIILYMPWCTIARAWRVQNCTNFLAARNYHFCHWLMVVLLSFLIICATKTRKDTLFQFKSYILNRFRTLFLCVELWPVCIHFSAFTIFHFCVRACVRVQYVFFLPCSCVCHTFIDGKMCWFSWFFCLFIFASNRQIKTKTTHPKQMSVE